MRVRSDSQEYYDNADLPKVYDIVSPDFSPMSIVQSRTGGRGGGGRITFTPGNGASGPAYPQYIGWVVPAANLYSVGKWIKQAAAQGVLGGRVFTFVDAPSTVFGATTQVGVNIMSDGTLKVVRANAQGTGVVLRGTDQAGDSQVTLLGVSTLALPTECYLEVRVVFHGSAGTIQAWCNNVQILNLTGKNTAISGLLQCTQILFGGYSSNGIGNQVRHVEDLNADIADNVVINNIAVSGDANEPVDRIGNRNPILLVGTADGPDLEWTPDPDPAHYLNVNEIPPDTDTLNSTADEDLKDNEQMQTAAGTGTTEVLLAYNGLVKSTAPVECGVSGDPANFRNFVYMEQTLPGEVHTSPSDTSLCALTDFVSRRAESECTISQDGEKVTLKPRADNTGTYYAFLTPLSAPPRVQNAAGPTRFAAAIFASTAVNVQISPAEARYTLPFYQPWQGYAVDTQDLLDNNGDFVEFKVLNQGIGLDFGLLNNAQANLFNPYTSPITAIHFREDVIGTPYYWIGPSFGYGGQTVRSYLGTDTFRLTRSGANVEVRQNGVLKETIPVTFPTHTNAFAFMGRWGWDATAIPPAYSLRPGVKEVFVRVGGSDCVTAIFTYNNVTPGTWPGADWFEWSQWGVEFNSGGSGGDATVFDPNNPGLGIDPVFGFDTNTTVEFRLVAGNVVLVVTDFVGYADNFDTKVGNVATFTYSRPYADTDDFVIAPPVSAYPVGRPVFPNPSFEYAYVNGAANMPLRLGVVCTENSDFALPDKAGVKEAEFTFLPSINPTNWRGYMQASGDKGGTVTVAPSTSKEYRQSMLGTDPSGNPITIATTNTAKHGYDDPA